MKLVSVKLLNEMLEFDEGDKDGNFELIKKGTDSVVFSDLGELILYDTSERKFYRVDLYQLVVNNYMEDSIYISEVIPREYTITKWEEVE